MVFLGKKEGGRDGKIKRSKRTKLVVLADGKGVPPGILTEFASLHVLTLMERILDKIVLPNKHPECIVYNHAVGSDKLRDAFE